MSRGLRFGIRAVLLYLAAGGLVALAAAGLAHAQGQMLEGSIASLDLRSGDPSLRLDIAGGRDRTLRLDKAGTSVLRDGQRARPEDLEIGQNVRVQAVERDGKHVAQFIEILPRAAAPGAAGQAEQPGARLAPAGYRAGDKLVRGFANFFTGVLEIPRTINVATNEQSVFYGWTAGLGKGLGLALMRMLAGTYEVLTFPIAAPNDYAPIIYPEFVWESPAPVMVGPGVPQAVQAR